MFSGEIFLLISWGSVLGMWWDMFKKKGIKFLNWSVPVGIILQYVTLFTCIYLNFLSVYIQFLLHLFEFYLVDKTIKILYLDNISYTNVIFVFFNCPVCSYIIRFFPVLNLMRISLLRTLEHMITNRKTRDLIYPWFCFACIFCFNCIIAIT